MRNHGFEWSAARESDCISASSSGVGESAIVPKDLPVEGAQAFGDPPEATPSA
jgi:hypothetical protein